MVEARYDTVWTYPSHFHKTISNFVAFIQTHIYPENQMKSRKSSCDIVGIKKKKKVFKRPGKEKCLKAAYI